MKCLTYAEAEAWFASFGVRISEHYSLSLPPRVSTERRIFIPNLQIDSTRLAFFSVQVVDWLANGCQRMLWLSNWETYTSNQAIFFERVRLGCNENRHLIEAPGHLFESSSYDRGDYDSRTAIDHQENAILSGLFLLMVSFNWDGYLVAQNQCDYVMLRDRGVMFFSPHDSKIDEAIALSKRFGQKFREIKQ